MLPSLRSRAARSRGNVDPHGIFWRRALSCTADPFWACTSSSSISPFLSVPRRSVLSPGQFLWLISLGCSCVCVYPGRLHQALVRVKRVTLVAGILLCALVYLLTTAYARTPARSSRLLNIAYPVGDVLLISGVLVLSP
jgi:hypothetical protein